MPVYAIALMLAGPVCLGAARVVLTLARWLGFGADPRPGFLDLRRRRV
jgi:hypothetical protein